MATYNHFREMESHTIVHSLTPLNLAYLGIYNDFYRAYQQCMKRCDWILHYAWERYIDTLHTTGEESSARRAAYSRTLLLSQGFIIRQYYYLIEKYKRLLVLQDLLEKPDSAISDKKMYNAYYLFYPDRHPYPPNPLEYIPLSFSDFLYYLEMDAVMRCYELQGDDKAYTHAEIFRKLESQINSHLEGKNRLKVEFHTQDTAPPQTELYIFHPENDLSCRQRRHYMGDRYAPVKLTSPHSPPDPENDKIWYKIPAVYCYDCNRFFVDKQVFYSYQFDDELFYSIQKIAKPAPVPPYIGSNAVLQLKRVQYTRRSVGERLAFIDQYLKKNPNAYWGLCAAFRSEIHTLISAPNRWHINTGIYRIDLHTVAEMAVKIELDKKSGST